MKDFKDFLNESEDDIDAEDIDDDVVESMWQFIVGLDDDIIEKLDDEQVADYVEIVEAVAGPDDEDLEEEGKTISLKKRLSKLKDEKLKKLYNQMKDEQLSASAAAQFKDIVKELKKRDIDLSEALPAKRVRRDVIQKRKASREHRKVKAKRKIQGRRKRKTAKFKRFKKRAKRLGKRGLTSTGKRKRTFINKG